MRTIESFQLFADFFEDRPPCFMLYLNTAYPDGGGCSSLIEHTYQIEKVFKRMNWYISYYQLSELQEHELAKLERWLRHCELGSIKISFKESDSRVLIYPYDNTD